MIKPIFDNVILKKIEIEKNTNSKILLTTSNEDNTNIGEIIAMGESCVQSKENGGELTKGNKVIFSDEYKKINYKEEDYYILNEEELLAIID